MNPDEKKTINSGHNNSADPALKGMAVGATFLSSAAAGSAATTAFMHEDAPVAPEVVVRPEPVTVREVHEVHEIHEVPVQTVVNVEHVENLVIAANGADVLDPKPAIVDPDPDPDPDPNPIGIAPIDPYIDPVDPVLPNDIALEDNPDYVNDADVADFMA